MDLADTAAPLPRAALRCATLALLFVMSGVGAESASAALPPPSVRLPVLFGVPGWAVSPESAPAPEVRSGEVRIVPDPHAWEV